MTHGKGVMQDGEEVDGRQAWKRETEGRKNQYGRQARQVIAAVVWLVGFWALQDLASLGHDVYAYQIILTAICAGAGLTADKPCCSLLGGLLGGVLAYSTVELFGVPVAEMVAMLGIAIYSGLRLFNNLTASGWLALSVVNIGMTQSGWEDIPLDLAALLVWGGAMWSRYSVYHERVARLTAIRRHRRLAQATRATRQKLLFDDLHEISNAVNGMQYVAGINQPPEKQAILERSIHRFHAAKERLVGRRITSLLEAIRLIAAKKEDGGCDAKTWE